MARKSYDKIYDEKHEAAPAEEPIVESAEAETKEVPEEKVVEKKETAITKPFMGIVTGGFSLNVRKTPNGEIVTTIPEGANVRVLDNSNDGWYKIESPSGFVMKKYIKKV